MSTPLISESSALKRDALFQLQRVTTTEGGHFLAKFALSDLDGGQDALLEHEFRVFERLRSERTPRAVRLGRDGDKLTAFYEDIAGVSLSACELRTARDGWNVANLQQVAKELCAALSVFHRAGLIVAGFSPRSFLYHPSAQRVLLVDAPFARVARAPAHGSDAYWLRSPYLAYAAPEVIGRLPFESDVRADLYALGAVLYELLSCHPPFSASDPVELIQCHLAKSPRSLLEWEPSLPAGIVQVVMKLLAKSPDDRFENVAALEDAWLHALDARAGGARVWLPMQSDRVRSAIPRLSTKLYGLNPALRTLRDKLSRTRTAAAVTFVEGDAGVGKTTLLQHTQKLLAHGSFCRGRFVRGGPVAPLSGWATALRELADDILTRDAASIEEWRKKVSSALGEGAALIGLLVPEWAAILGDGPRLRDQQDSGLNRLAIAIHALLRCHSGSDLPVVVVLDDLQWADSSSLRILELVLELPEPVNLLVLCGVRTPNDAGPNEGLDLDAVCTSLLAAGVEVDRVRLGQWVQEDVRELLHDSFGSALRDADVLADVVLARTHGNPFFVLEFLRSLIGQSMLAFDHETDTWSWQSEAIVRLPPVESLVAFLTHKILGLAVELEHTLCWAACLGIAFEVSEFAAITGASIGAATAQLDAAVLEGLLLPRSGGYEFAHDRVFEACCGLTTLADRARRCLQIGRTLLSRYEKSCSDELAHKLAGYFNTGAALITDDGELLTSAELNYVAGTLAKQSGAFSQAFEYFQHGLAFLRAVRPAEGVNGEAAWRMRPELTQNLFEEAAEAAGLNGRCELMHELCAVSMSQTRSPLQKVRVYEIRVGGFSAEKRFPEAVAAACEILAELGVTFPRRPGIVHAVAGYLTTKRRLFSHPVDRLIELPANRDPRVKAVSRIMQAMYSSAYLGHRNLFPLIVCRHIAASLKHGNEDYSCVTYIAFAIVLAAMGDFERAYQLGTVALELLESLDADEHKAKVFMGMYVFVFPWKHHLQDAIPYYNAAVAAGLEHGDFEYASHLLTLTSIARLHSGQSLRELAPEVHQYLAKIGSLRQERSIILQQLMCQLVHDLRERTDGAILAGPHYDAATVLPRCLQPLDRNLVFNHYLVRLMLCLYLGDRTGALEAAASARTYLDAAFGLYLGAIFAFWEALLWLWAARAGVRGRLNAQLRSGRSARQLAHWARNAPMTFQNKFHLVEAERCRTSGRFERAAFHFERAIELSQAHGLTHDTALAQEFAAEFYFARGMERLGRHYLRDCHASHRRWGATAVARRLERAYPQHFAVLWGGDEGQGPSPAPRLLEDLDYRALLESSQLLSAELRLPNVLERLLRTMFEHAGAQRALLVLERRGRLYVEAEADVDSGGVEFFSSEPADDSSRVCRSVLRYVTRTTKAMVLANAAEDPRFDEDPYVQTRRPKSVLCTPIVYQGRLLGAAYLENNRVSHVFTEARLEVAGLLATQAAISIASARFHALELEAQQARINPHFLFNALSSIADVALQDGPRTEEAIVKLAQLYRYVLATSMEARVTLAQELEMVRSYLALEQLRFGSKLEFTVACEDGVSAVHVPGLIIQPLVENSIRHAIAPKLGQGRVWVHASQHGGLCRIVVQDDGDGHKHETAGTGFGLRSIQERLALLYRNEYGISITRRAG